MTSIITCIILLVTSIASLVLSWWFDRRAKVTALRASEHLGRASKHLDEAKKLHDEAREIISKLRTEPVSRTTEPSGWIPVAERLPKLHESVIGFCVLGQEPKPSVNEVYFASHRWSSVRSIDVPNVTHWMPMPEAPKQ